jgi:hypothetical protein
VLGTAALPRCTAWASWMLRPECTGA